MTSNKKKVFFVLGGAAAALALAAAIFALTFDINSYRLRIEAFSSGATGLEVRIKGKMGLSFFPFGISARDIHVTGRGGEVISVEVLKLEADLMPLLRKQLRVTSCELVKPAVIIVRDSEGKYNFERTEKKPTGGKPGAAFSLNELKLSKGELVYLDRKSGEKTEFRDFNLAVTDLSVVDIPGFNISFTGNLDCKEIRKNNLRINNLKSPVKAGKGVIHLTDLSMDIFGSKAEGDAVADKSEADAVYKINLKVSKLDFEKLQESFGANKVIGGKGDLNASLTFKEKGTRDLMRSLDGTFSLRGDNLVMHTMDLDKVLSSYETSQNFNLVDLGAFFIAGPFSTIAIKGYRYGDVYNQTRRGQGAITQFISHWKLSDGVADAIDCALATRHNRIALKGRLNLISERYDDVIVALLDERGCVKLKQGISGPFGSPRVGAVNAIGSLTAPISNLFRKAKRFIEGARCEVFYNGAVKQPPK